MRAETALGGFRILDLTQAVAGPFCTMLLADMGAEVLKIEQPGRGDKLRAQKGLPVQGPDTSPFICLNRNKKSITLNLHNDKGRTILLDLAKSADVLVQNWRPGIPESMGLGYDRVSSVNPRIIYCSISGFGQSGPYRSKRGIDPIVQAFAGIMSLTGEPGGRPLFAGGSWGELPGP